MTKRRVLKISAFTNCVKFRERKQIKYNNNFGTVTFTENTYQWSRQSSMIHQIYKKMNYIIVFIEKALAEYNFEIAAWIHHGHSKLPLIFMETLMLILLCKIHSDLKKLHNHFNLTLIDPPAGLLPFHLDTSINRCKSMSF